MGVLLKCSPALNTHQGDFSGHQAVVLALFKVWMISEFEGILMLPGWPGAQVGCCPPLGGPVCSP